MRNERRKSLLRCKHNLVCVVVLQALQFGYKKTRKDMRLMDGYKHKKHINTQCWEQCVLGGHQKLRVTLSNLLLVTNGQSFQTCAYFPEKNTSSRG